LEKFKHQYVPESGRRNQATTIAHPIQRLKSSL